MDIIPDKWLNQWSSEEVRVLVLTSLGIQIGLIFIAPLRKRSANMMLKLTVWLLYLAAELVPPIALGNISKRADRKTMPGEVTLLWAPFLVLHLGGPDSITSYTIEDNELWWRHPLGLVIQVIAAVYAFSQSPPNPGLWKPTILVCISGLIKFVERTLALRSGSKDHLTDKIISELGPSAKLGRLCKLRNSTYEYHIIPSSNISNESEAIWEGYRLFNIFKGLLVDVTFSADMLIKIQEALSEISGREAFKLVAIELSFLHDILHTKAVHIHCTSGRLLRCFSIASIIAALVVFHNLDMQTYSSKDIIITYTLFGAGLSVEVIAIVLLVFSDWMVVSLCKGARYRYFASAIDTIVKKTLRNGKPRWSRTIGKYNLVGLCLRDRNTVCARIMRKIKLKHKWDNMWETGSVPLPGLLEDMMLIEAQRRSQNVHIDKVLAEARSYRGSSTLERYSRKMHLGWSINKDYDECIILWHIATDICYYKEFYKELTPNQSNMNDNCKEAGDVSWKTSNYMVYLLTQQQSMMPVGYGKIRFEAACAVLKKTFMKFQGDVKLDHTKARDVLERNIDDVLERNDDLVSHDHLCCRCKGEEDKRKLEDDYSQTGWRCWGGRKGEEDNRELEDVIGKLVLKDGLKLAKDLQEVDQHIRWKLISETWVEMLGYAAIHCDSYQHAKSLSRGGELLTHFWLLMAQMGVVEEQKMQKAEYAYV